MLRPGFIECMDSSQREACRKYLAGENWDLIVIGGGITGAGIALDAASRGLRVCLVEKGDYASGTSSRSTRLIHGGLRYLKNLEFSLVREAGKERGILSRIAPHLVWSEPMLLPLVQGGSFGKVGLWLGLWFYDRLAGVSISERRKILGVKEALAIEPLLKKDSLKGAALYREYRTIDARLVMAVLKSAAVNGACCRNYCKAESLSLKDGKLSGIEVHDEWSGQRFSIQGKSVVNAAGPWVMDFAGEENRKGFDLVHSKGSHIVIERKKLPLVQPVYFNSPDKRLLFAIPDGDTVYAGTTDQEYTGSLEHPRFTPEDSAYILAALNHQFKVSLQISDVLAGWAGIRPLLSQPGKSTKDISRKDEILESASGLITIAGGKLTGYRKMAERVVNRVCEKILKVEKDRRLDECKTEYLVLTDAQFEDAQSPGQFAKSLETDFPFCEPAKLMILVRRFGRSANQILLQAKQILQNENKSAEDALLLAEWDYCVHHEACTSSADFLIRRTQEVFLGKENLEKKLWVLQNGGRLSTEGNLPAANEFQEYLP